MVSSGFPDAVGLLVGRGSSWITLSGFRPTWSTDGLPNIATDTVITGIACGDFSLELGKILPGKRADRERVSAVENSRGVTMKSD